MHTGAPPSQCHTPSPQGVYGSLASLASLASLVPVVFVVGGEDQLSVPSLDL